MKYSPHSAPSSSFSSLSLSLSLCHRGRFNRRWSLYTIVGRGLTCTRGVHGRENQRSTWINDPRGWPEGWTHTECQRRGMRTILSAASYGLVCGFSWRVLRDGNAIATAGNYRRNSYDHAAQRDRARWPPTHPLPLAAVWFYLRRASSPWRWREEDVSLRETTSHHPENLPRCAFAKWNFSPHRRRRGKEREGGIVYPRTKKFLSRRELEEVVQAGQILKRNTVVERSFRWGAELSGNSDEQSADLLSGIALERNSFLASLWSLLILVELFYWQ